MKPAYAAIIRDTLLLLPRLTYTGLRVFMGQLFSKPSNRLRVFTSIDWLATHLDLEPQLIRSASIEEVHSGTATRSRLRIRYAEALTAAPGPASLFIKSRPQDFASALFGALFELGGNEVSFYRHIRPGLPVKTPGVYYCEGDSKNYVMLLEDLTDRGCDFRDLTSQCSLEDARSVVTTLAQLHARFWQSQRFETDLAWVNRFETNRDDRLLKLVRQLSVPIAYKKFSQVFPERIREVIPQLMNNYHRLEQQWAQEPRTLLHGDAHLGNMYFQDGQAGLLDWQVSQYGQGMRDIGYFLINSMDEELRLAHQEELIRHYLLTLHDLGVALDFDTAWRQYRLQSVYAWIAGVVTAPSNFQEKSVVTSGLSRSCKAILDLDAIELIREL
ncbi:MAG: phosphotransferase [Myxococcales bacterium]|nr:phosphotransferase [Myxococcales bacterium]